LANTSFYINLNTRSLTSNIKNTAVKDKTALKFMSDQLNEVEDLAHVLTTPINLAISTNINKIDNSINLAAGTKIKVKSNYILTIKSQGVEVSGGDPNDQVAWKEAQNMATALATLLRNAGGTMNTVAYSEREYQRWTDNVLKIMKYLGIDTSGEFTVNGIKFLKNSEGILVKQDSIDAQKAFELQCARNRTYEFADEKTRKRVDYVSGCSLSNAPDEVKQAWQKTLEETGINPFPAGIGSTLAILVQEKDFATGGDNDLFGDTVDSAKVAIESILQRIDNPLGVRDAEFRANEKIFYASLLEKLQQL